MTSTASPRSRAKNCLAYTAHSSHRVGLYQIFRVAPCGLLEVEEHQLEHVACVVVITTAVSIAIIWLYIYSTVRQCVARGFSSCRFPLTGSFDRTTQWSLDAGYCFWEEQR